MHEYLQREKNRVEVTSGLDKEKKRKFKLYWLCDGLSMDERRDDRNWARVNML
jgi:hypothetical protein